MHLLSRILFTYTSFFSVANGEMVLQGRNLFNDVAVYGVVNNQNYLGNIGVCEGKAAPLRNFGNSVVILNKIYKLLSDAENAKTVDKKASCKHLDRIVSVISAYTHSASDMEHTWFSGKPPEGIKTSISKEDGTYHLDDKEVKELKRFVDENSPINREATISKLVYDWNQRLFFIWIFVLSEDFKEITHIEEQSLKGFSK